jgi:carbamoyl-phosphate synthase small subunit
MTGYQEIYTDPSYAGQVIINTTAHIGNYGVINQVEAESDRVQIAGMVCNEFASIHSRETADGSLQDYLAKANLVGISGIDTRALVRHIRTQGVMNCLISSEIFDLNTNRTINLWLIPTNNHFKF